MPKKTPNKKNEPAPAAATTRREYVGWPFWFVSFAILAGPFWYFSRQSVYESDRDGFIPYVMAGALAALGAGVLSYAVNLYYRVRAENEKKVARKGKKQARHQ